MAVKQHSQVNVGSRHAIHNLTYPDATDRAAGVNEGGGITADSTNQYQIAKQDDDQSLWSLLDTSPLVWSQIWSSQYTNLDSSFDGFKITSNATVLGGVNNDAQTLGSRILGGRDNTASGQYSTAIGSNVTVSGDGSLGLCDDSGTSLTVSSDNQLKSYFTNGYSLDGGTVSINTTDTSAQLSVETDSTSSSIGAFIGPSNNCVTLDVDATGGGLVNVYHPAGIPSVRVQGNPPRIGIGTSSPTQALDISSGNIIRLRTSHTPSSASDTGEAGSIAWDNNHIYICVATDTWKRVGISTW